MASTIWKGAISFGLLNIPVMVKKAQEGQDLSFKMLDESDFSPIKYRRVNAKTGEEVPWPQIVKGYEHESGQYVIMSKEDFAAANPKATQTIDIQDFVEFEDIDLMFFEKPYYLVPQKNGTKGYFLLAEALRNTNKVAIAKIVMRSKMHLACIMAKDDYLVLEMLRFAHEVLETDEVDYLEDVKKPEFNPKEIKMAQELIEGMTAEWKPDQYKDTYVNDVMAIIERKVKEGKVKEVFHPEIAHEEETASGPVLDLMPLLKKSLEAKKKQRSLAGEAKNSSTTKSKKKTVKKTASKKKAG
jgi:DNA end-binding protein Ku